MRIRDTTRDDREALRALLRQTTFLESHEISVAEELIEAHLSGSADYVIHVAEEEVGDGGVPPLLGFVCYGHNPVTDAIYDVYWIVVAPFAQRRGVGRALLDDTEHRVRALGGRAIIVETSGRPEYRAAERLYESCGYTRVAEVTDFYKPGDAMHTYKKVLIPNRT